MSPRSKNTAVVPPSVRRTAPTNAPHPAQQRRRPARQHPHSPIQAPPPTAKYMPPRRACSTRDCSVASHATNPYFVRIFFHAGLCRFEIVGGVCAGCWWGDGSWMEQSAIAAPHCSAVRIIFHLVFGCALTGLLFFLPNVVRDPLFSRCTRREKYGGHALIRPSLVRMYQ